MNAYIAMSGGVDSSVAALLTRQAGHDITGVTLRLHDKQGCGSGGDALEARAVCQQLGAPHLIWDGQPRFRASVMDHFAQSYLQGATPNPCINCNRYLKFGLLLDKALEEGADFVVTGHYARVARGENGRWLLKKGLSPQKDQSYVLYTLSQHQLSHLRLPLGEYTKEEVRAIAAGAGFANAQKPDSQDICFVPDGDYAAFLESQGVKMIPGDFVDESGRVLGRHKGLERYTTGQRKGLGVSTGEPVYVVRKDLAHGAVVLGPDSALFTRTLTANRVNWISIPSLEEPMAVTAKTRYSQRESAAVIEPLAGGRVRAVFDEPQRAITAGQAVVFYDGEAVVGGGIIE